MGRGRIVALAGLTLLALVWLTAAVASNVMLVNGFSMMPLLHSGQVLVLNRAAYQAGVGAGPHRGDLVIFRREQEYLVKRVIGLPGELVRVDTGRVFIDGVQLDEPYVLDTDDYTYPLQGGTVRVPDGQYFVLGDNRPESTDSHLGWFVAADELVAQAWPLPVVLPNI